MREVGLDQYINGEVFPFVGGIASTLGLSLFFSEEVFPVNFAPILVAPQESSRRRRRPRRGRGGWIWLS